MVRREDGTPAAHTPDADHAVENTSPKIKRLRIAMNSGSLASKVLMLSPSSLRYLTSARST